MGNINRQLIVTQISPSLLVVRFDSRIVFRQRQLETLLNSMQDAVIAVSADGLVQWANQRMDRISLQRVRLQAPARRAIS